MTYSEFSLEIVRKLLGLAIKQEPLFENVETLEVTSWLRETLDKGMQLALISEKARSEFMVVPILLASRELSHNRFYIYSGQRLDVDPEKGLTGECDFILTNTPPSPVVQSPIIMIVEAKKNDIEAGLGQCVAQMVGARIFNQREESPIETIFGCVTTGEAWQFLKLEKEVVYVDDRHYYIIQVGEILGMFQAIVACYPPSMNLEADKKNG
jgi:hypothetical protein